MGNLFSRQVIFSQSTMMDVGILDSVLDVLLLVLLLVTCYCLIKSRRTSPTFTVISLAFAIIVLIILFCDIGYNVILLIFALNPVELKGGLLIYWYDELFALSVTLTALKIYQRFVLILLNAFVSLNRACAVFLPLQYTKFFKMKNTITGIVFVFQLCLPIFVVYAFQLYDCLYLFDPQTGALSYRNNTCRSTIVTLEYMVFAIVHSSSVLLDILVTACLYRQIKLRRTTRDTMDFSFMMQTLVLSFSGAFVTLYLHTFGAWYYGKAWIDHLPKFNDLVLALIYIASISLFNKHVRREVIFVICCCGRLKKAKIQHVETVPFSAFAELPKREVDHILLTYFKQ